MSTNFELFPGKNLSGLFEDIYNNQINKKKHISDVITELRRMVRHAGDIAVVGPIIKDLLDTSVKNDEQLVKLATIAQRIISVNSKADGGDVGVLSDDERKQLLLEIQEVQDEVKNINVMDNEISEAKKKLKG